MHFENVHMLRFTIIFIIECVMVSNHKHLLHLRTHLIKIRYAPLLLGNEH